MVKESLVEMMVNVSRYFGKTPPKMESFDEWMKDLHQIPNEPMSWIEGKLKANKYPDNPPQAIRRLYYLWLEEHPERVEREQAGCDECTKGWLWASKNGQSRAFRCLHCNNHGNQPGIAVTRSQLQAHGWSLHWTHGTNYQIKGMVEYQMGRRVMPEGILKWAEKNLKPPEDDWQNQF